MISSLAMFKTYLSFLLGAAWILVSAGSVHGQPAEDTTEFEASVIVEEKEDTQVKAQIEQRISVSGQVTEERVQKFLEQRYRQLSDRSGFTHYDSPTNIFVYVFGSEERAEDGGVGWMGAVMKGASDEQPNIQVKPDRIEDHNQGPEARLGIEEEKRREIFKALVRAEDRARQKARSNYPNDYDQRRELQNELQEKYEAEVRNRYDITEEVQDSIVDEGMEKQWPFPEP